MLSTNKLMDGLDKVEKKPKKKKKKKKRRKMMGKN